MGAVARNRWKRLFIGATAERTLEHLPCDLLIVKPDWFQTPVESRGARSGVGALLVPLGHVSQRELSRLKPLLQYVVEDA